MKKKGGERMIRKTYKLPRDAIAAMIAGCAVARGKFHDVLALFADRNKYRWIERRDAHRAGVPCMFFETKGRGLSMTISDVTYCTCDIDDVKKKTALVCVNLPSGKKPMRIKLDDPRLLLSRLD